MNRYDRIKSIGGFILLAAVLIPFTLLGKDDTITRSVAASALILWLFLMVWANWKKKSEEENGSAD